MNTTEEIEARMIPQNDHDWIIRIHERLVVLQQDRNSQVVINTEHGKRLASLELWRENVAGQNIIMVRNASIISSVIGSVVAGVIVYFVTRQ